MCPNSSVPFFEIKAQYAPLREELNQAFLRIFDSGAFILGEDVHLLEREIGDYLHVAHSLGVSNGTDALSLALRALDVGPGDEVLTSPFTFFATVSAICSLGAKPVFADICPRTFNIDLNRAEDVLKKNPKIKVLLPVHLFGQSVDEAGLQNLKAKYGVSIVEDGAQGIGAEFNGKKVGSFGDFTTFSFYPTKNLGALGDAGLLVTPNEKLAEKAKMLRVHGSKVTYHHDFLGANYRIDTLQAAFLRIFLKHLETWTTRRRQIAARYDSAFKNRQNLTAPLAAPGARHVYHQYAVRIKKNARDTVKEQLRERGVGSNVYYPIPCHLQKALSHLGFEKGSFPHAELAANEVLSLPIYPTLSDAQVETVIFHLNELVS